MTCMLWIMLIVALSIILAFLCWLFLHGANMRLRNPKYGKQMDDEQEKAVSQMRNNSINNKK